MNNCQSVTPNGIDWRAIGLEDRERDRAEHEALMQQMASTRIALSVAQTRNVMLARELDAARQALHRERWTLFRTQVKCGVLVLALVIVYLLGVS